MNRRGIDDADDVPRVVQIQGDALPVRAGRLQAHMDRSRRIPFHPRVQLDKPRRLIATDLAADLAVFGPERTVNLGLADVQSEDGGHDASRATWRRVRSPLYMQADSRRVAFDTVRPDATRTVRQAAHLRFRLEASATDQRPDAPTQASLSRPLRNGSVNIQATEENGAMRSPDQSNSARLRSSVPPCDVVPFSPYPPSAQR